MRTVLRSRSIRIFAITQFLLEVQFWFPLWLIYLKDLGFSITIAVLADGVFRIVVVACEVPLGILADRLGRKRTYQLICLLAVITFAAITQINSIQVLFVVWVVWGVLWALTSGAGSAYLYELVEQDDLKINTTRAFGLIRAIGQTAVLASLVTAGLLYDVDPRLPFGVTSALAGIALLLTLLLPEIRGSQRTLATLRTVIGDLRSALTGQALRQAVMLSILMLFYGWSIQILFQPLVLELGLSPAASGLMYAGYAAASVIGGLVAGFVTDRRRRLAIGAGFVIVFATTALTGLAPGLGPMAWLIVMGFGYALGWTTLEVFVNHEAPRAVRATIGSAISCLGGIGIAVARPGLGAFADYASTAASYLVWAGVGVLILIAAGVILARVRGAGPARPASGDPA